LPPKQLRPPALEAGVEVTLGRSPHCDYVVDDRTVSARHAELRRTPDGWELRDLGSRNGTRVNGWLVKQQRVAEGDEIALGASSFVFAEP
jgi:pSer/pThr/pTyr-binding forkhead associated (FHA) protein